MIIYAENITTRLKFIADFIFNEILGLELEYINDMDVILDTNEPIINYSFDTLDNSLKIIPHGLLEQNNIHVQKIETDNWNGLPIFFLSPAGDGLPFDILAASFYLLSRYEEYLPHAKDDHGRFEYAESIAHKHGFLKIPIVDHWALELGKLIMAKWSGLSIKQRKFKHISTIDVDIAWAFKNRPLHRVIGASIRSLIKRDFQDIRDRFAVLMGRKEDPSFTFRFIKEIHEKAGIRPVFFIQVGKYGKYDKNIPLRNKKFRKLLLELSTWAELGVHPSYASHDNLKALTREIKSFKEFTGKKKIISRQHYLRLTFPDTYQALADLGVEEEYSMGYAGNTGFRASTCTPYFFFNLTTSEITAMKIVPFQVMENSMKKYLKYSPDQGKKEIDELREKVKQVNGTFVTLWHNQSISDYRDWKGWREIFEKMFE